MSLQQRLLQTDSDHRIIKVTSNNPLSNFEKASLLMRERLLATELNWVREQLGENPKRCPNCGEQVK